MKKSLLTLAFAVMTLAPMSAPAAVRVTRIRRCICGQATTTSRSKRAGNTHYAENIFVAAGKTIHIRPEL
jgi:hypothetical protein